jgi:DNA transposition AAA+ family ATPase
VEKLRAEIERTLPPLVRTEDTATIEAAFAAAGDEHEIADLLGKWRHGKTEQCERQWLVNLHRAVWLHCPSDNTERGFIFALAQALGLGIGRHATPSRLREKIKRALGVGLIEMIVVDEAQNLWPSDLIAAKPMRAEFVRELRDSLGVGFVLIATEQFALSLELAKRHNSRWSPGQLAGRRRVFKLRDRHTDKEVRAIAKLHAAGPIDSDALEIFRAFADAEEGYLGAMVSAIRSARRSVGPDGVITATLATVATKRQGTDERIVKLAAGARKLQRGRFQVVRKEAA